MCTVTESSKHSSYLRDQRNNLTYLPDGELLYNAAAMVIVHDVDTNQQQFLLHDSEDVCSFILHPDGQHVLYGEQEIRPSIAIVDMMDKDTKVATVEKGLEIGVSNLDITPDGRFLAASCMDDQATFVVYDLSDLKQPQLLTLGKPASKRAVVDIIWVNDVILAIFGQGFLEIYKLEDDALVGPFQSKQQEILIVAKRMEGSKFIAGGTEGELLLWYYNANYETGPGTIGEIIRQNSIRAHKAAIETIEIFEDNGVQRIMTGSKDGKISILDQTLALQFKIEVSTLIPAAIKDYVRAVAINMPKKRIAVGLMSGEIYELSFQELTKSGFKPTVREVTRCHYNPARSLTASLNSILPVAENCFLSCGGDGTVRLWSSEERRCLKILNLNIDEDGVVLPLDSVTHDLRPCSNLTCMDIAKVSQLLLVGCADGSIRVISIKAMFQTVIYKPVAKAVKVIKFSPDEKIVAVGYEDASVAFYSIPTFKFVETVRQGNSAVGHLDWSSSGAYLLVGTIDDDLYVVDVAKCKIVADSTRQIATQDWLTWTSSIGFNVRGLYNSNELNTAYTCADRSPAAKNPLQTEKYMLAAGTPKAILNIFKYPCTTPGTESLELIGHSGPISSVKFDQSGERIYSAGSDDLTLIQWKVTYY